ncbi:MAG: hypothetical protein ABSC63_14340, partial [Candidatus Binataceae bacterium]
SSVALVTLPHGGFLLLPSPIFRSGEDSRHSIFNSLQDIAGFLKMRLCQWYNPIQTLTPQCPD